MTVNYSARAAQELRTAQVNDEGLELLKVLLADEDNLNLFADGVTDRAGNFELRMKQVDSVAIIS